MLLHETAAGRVPSEAGAGMANIPPSRHMQQILNGTIEPLAQASSWKHGTDALLEWGLHWFLRLKRQGPRMRQSAWLLVV